MMTSATLSYALDEVVSVLAYESFYTDGPFYMPLLFQERTSSGQRERMASLGGLTLWSDKVPTVTAAEDAMPQEFEKDFTHTPKGKRVPLSRELVDDQKWGLLEEIGNELGITAKMTMEKEGFDVLNNAFTTETSEDGLSICNDAHLNAAGGNSQDNSGTTALSMTSVASTRTAMRKFTNYRGDKIYVNPDEIWIPVDLEETAWEIARSSLRPDTTNNSANLYNGMFTLYVSPWLTDTASWFMADSRLRKMNMIWFQRVGLEIYGDGNLDAGTRVVGGYMRYSKGCRDWRWVYGHNV